MGISIIFLTFNSEKTIRRSLKQACQVSDDVHSVDSFSTDATVEILHEFKVKVLQHPFENYGTQRNWAIENVPAKFEWQLHLDSDEELTDELVQELNQLKEHFPPDIDGYFLPRMPAFLERKIYYGGMFPIWHMRLFRKGKGHCEARKYDQHFFVEGKTAQLKGPMVDYVCGSISEWVIRHNRWADAEVDELMAGETEGRISAASDGNPVQKQRYWRSVYDRFPLFVRPFLLFFYRYVLKLGFLDGIEGFIFFLLKDFWFRFLIDAKMYERRLKEKKK